MNISERLKDDLKTAMKAGERERVDVLRFANAQLQNRAIEKRGTGEGEILTEEEMEEVLRKDVKRRRDAIELFKQGNRADLVEKEEKDVAIILTYLPAAPTEEQIRETVQAIRQGGITEFPMIMKEVKARLKAADGALVAKIVKESA